MLSEASPNKHANRQLLLATLAFALCFLAWGLIGAFAPPLRDRFGLSGLETGVLVAVPVLLGSLARIPMGLLADRLGGRILFVGLIFVSAVPVALLPAARDFGSLLAIAFFLGLAGSSFPVGVAFVAGWFPEARQGWALGLYGLGNLGLSVAVFAGPLLALAIGWQSVFRMAAVLLIVGGIAFALVAQNPPIERTSGGLDRLRRVLPVPDAWCLALFYFFTFGGLVAFGFYLPILLRDEFALSPTDAGLRTAGLVVLATLMRPIGGWLADQIGGARVLAGVFLGVVPFAMLLAWPSLIPFSVGALGCAAILGTGNGAVFKLVPQFFPRDPGTAAGLVGALGGLGGLFPPVLLGLCQETMGRVWPGFLLLAMLAAVCWFINQRVFLARQLSLEATFPPALTPAIERLRAGSWATMLTALLVASIVVGSRNLQNFDPALVIYTFAVIFATWGIVSHYWVWLQKPPTRVYWQRGWQIIRKQGLGGLARTVGLSLTHLFGQGFIRQRSLRRWAMHQLIFWGCLLAVAVTFPLVFGWIHFRSAPSDQMIYVPYLFGFPVGTFAVPTVVSWIIFHLLDFAALMVLTGVALAMWRRMRDRGAQAVQEYGNDFMPLILLTAVSATGLALTVSNLWLRGSFYAFLMIVHAVSVVAVLLYLPFGKFFHIFQRPAQLGVKLYQEAGAKGEGAICARCRERFTSRLHLDDLKVVLPQLGFNYAFSDRDGHWQDLCPACKRKVWATAQLRQKEASRGAPPPTP